MIILGIESSCDETAASIVNDKKEILAQTILSQQEHIEFGGVVPEIAARSHLEYIDGIISDTLKKANLTFDDLDAVAAAAGPGLIGGVVVGVMTAKAICLAKNIPFIAVNHLEGHALMPRLIDNIKYPYLLLLASGGHCQILEVSGPDNYKRLGTTIDDAAGEAFDKTAKMLNLGYPGGPKIEKLALNGDENRFTLPRPLKGKDGCNLSFSGLKTATRHIIESYAPDGKINNAQIPEQDLYDICASFQLAISDCFTNKLSLAIKEFKSNHPQGEHLVISGGVAANKYIREKLETLANKNGLKFAAPPIKLCTDNGTMIAWAGIERLQKGLTSPLDFKPKPRWPLDDTTPQARGAGVKA